jgi:hypothetical protein
VDFTVLSGTAVSFDGLMTTVVSGDVGVYPGVAVTGRVMRSLSLSIFHSLLLSLCLLSSLSLTSFSLSLSLSPFR